MTEVRIVSIFLDENTKIWWLTVIAKNHEVRLQDLANAPLLPVQINARGIPDGHQLLRREFDDISVIKEQLKSIGMPQGVSYPVEKSVHNRVLFKCSQGGTYKSQDAGLRKVTTRKTNCPWSKRANKK